MRTATYRLNNKSLRAKLRVRSKPYFTSLAAGLSLGFVQRGAGRAGTWVSRVQNGERIVSDGGSHSKYKTRQLGAADDLPGMIADGVTILTYDQASAMARQHAVEIARGPVRKALTVRAAVERYLDHMARRKGAECRSTISKFSRVLRHPLADIEVNKLTLTQLQAWQLSMVKRDEQDSDVERRSKDSANRILRALKAALNHCFDHRSETGVVTNDPWGRSLKQFRDTAARREFNFTVSDVLRLIKAAEPSFASVLKSAFFSGCRPGELCKLRVRDFKAAARQLAVAKSKTKARIVTLTSEGAEFFTTLTRGKLPDAYLLTKSDGIPWTTEEFRGPMQAAVVSAGLYTMAELLALPRRERPVVYSIRHSYASRSIENGLSLLLVAENLGNSVSMLEKNYVKVLDQKRRELIEAHAPSLVVNGGAIHG